MEMKIPEPHANLLPSYLISDIESDEFDKEMKFHPSPEHKNSSSNGMAYNISPIIPFNELDKKDSNNNSYNPDNNLLFNQNNYNSLGNVSEKNLFQYTNINEYFAINSMNSIGKYFSHNPNEENYLKYQEYSNIKNNIINMNGCNSNNYSIEKKEPNNIINLLKNNPNINSYIYIVDKLSKEDLLKMFSFILKNIMIFASNSQSYLIIDKIISLYNSSSINSKEIKDITFENNINENIFEFLSTFFSKRIIFLINSNNYISSVLNLVIKLGYPKNNFIFQEIKQDFKNYSFNRQGCILIQNLFPLGNENQKQNLLNEILNLYDELITDRYGHYLFKYLLYKMENGEKYYNIIFNKIINGVKKYANNKYSSVVIERLLDSSNDTIKNKIIEKICSNEKDVVELIYHAYGNYVLQKIISVTKDNQILGLIHKTIMKNKNSLYKLSYGKKIMKEINVAYTLK